jgi:SMI1-KNR4 cell-wall
VPSTLTILFVVVTEELEKRFSVKLARSYRDYLSSRGPGPMDSHPDFYVEMYAPEVVGKINLEPALPQGLFLIGSNGSREHLALDLRREPPPIVMTDFTSGEGGIVEQAASFEEFVEVVRTRGLEFSD